MTEKPFVVHVITGLGNGGAERTLFRVCTNDKKYRHHVISLVDKGSYGDRLIAAGIGVTTIGMKGSLPRFADLWALWRQLRRLRPDVLQTWMYHADLLGGLIGRLAGVRRICWNIRHTSLDRNSLKRSTIWVAKTCAVFSRWLPNNIICCAHSAKESHAAFGYDERRMVVIHNGYDKSDHQVDPAAFTRFRMELKIADKVPLVGMVARWDPNKDHRGLFEALNLLKQEGRAFHLVLIGPEMNVETPALAELLSEYEIADDVSAIGPRSDIYDVFSGLDVHVLSSRSEGFPNVLAEAMLCGTPCVATDAGDAAAIVGDTGWIVPTCNPRKLAMALGEAMVEIQDQSAWFDRQQRSKERIEQHFSIEAMVTKYDAVWSASRE